MITAQSESGLFLLLLSLSANIDRNLIAIAVIIFSVSARCGADCFPLTSSQVRLTDDLRCRKPPRLTLLDHATEAESKGTNAHDPSLRAPSLSSRRVARSIR